MELKHILTGAVGTRWIAGLMFVLLGSVGSPRSQPPAAMPEFIPELLETPHEGQPVLHDQTWVYEASFGVLRMQMLDAAQRLAFIRHVAGEFAPDPFAAPGNEPEHFIAFVVQLENTGDEQISFNPLSTYLISNREWDNQIPLGLTDLAFLYRAAGRELPPAYERVGEALLAHPATLDPGKSLAGLLVFRAVHPKTRTLHLQPVLVLSSGDILRPSASYRWVKPEKGKKMKNDEKDE